MSRKHLLFVLLGISLPMVIFGCKAKEEPKKTEQSSSVNENVVRKQTEVTVPASVKGKWKSVKLSIMDKDKNQEGFVVIEIGKAMKINDTNLVIKVETFLPHFIMEGTTLTSSSNTPKNPAVQVHITENGQDVFKGWLFTLYPNTHASQHSRYGFGLVDFYPAK